MKAIHTKRKTELIIKAALAKKAKDLLLIDLKKIGTICDYFIIASGDSTVQIDTIADNIEKELLSHGCRLWHREGSGEALWILLDYGDIVVHIFHREARGFYNLEKLWHDGPQKKFKETTLKRKKRRRPLKRNIN